MFWKLLKYIGNLYYINKSHISPYGVKYCIITIICVIWKNIPMKSKWICSRRLSGITHRPY